MALLGSDSVALTQGGAYDAVANHCEIEGTRKPQTRSRFSVRDAYCHLMAVGEASAAELQTFFRAGAGDSGDRGRYAEHQVSDWWEDVAAPNLRELPGTSVEEVDDAAGQRSNTWAFDGISQSDALAFADEEQVIGLGDLREVPTVQAENTLDELGVERRGIPRQERDDDRAAVMRLYRRLLTGGGLSREALIEAVPDTAVRAADPADRFASIEEYLRELPGVGVEQTGPRDPDEIPIETMQDVLDAREELDTESAEMWRCTLDPTPDIGDIATSVTAAP